MTELGESARGFAVGDRVVCLSRGGAYADETVADARTCLKLPAGSESKDLCESTTSRPPSPSARTLAPFDPSTAQQRQLCTRVSLWRTVCLTVRVCCRCEAAALLVNYGTAHLALTTRGLMKPGESVLVTAAAGGVGLATVELARKLGAGQIIAAAGSADKLELAKARGADVGIDYTGLDGKGFRAALKQAAGDQGVDVVVDMAGGELLEPAVRSLNWNGRAVVVGFAAGGIPKIPANILLVKNVAVSGLFWGAHLLHDPKTLLTSANELLAMWANGDITPHVCARVPLSRAHDAFDMLESRRSTGKVVVVPDA